VSDVDPHSDGGLVQRFADELRAIRGRAGNPDFRSMARRAGCAPSTLSTAAAGRKLPTLETALAFARACHADPDAQAKVAALWRQTRSALRPPGVGRPAGPGRPASPRTTDAARGAELTKVSERVRPALEPSERDPSRPGATPWRARWAPWPAFVLGCVLGCVLGGAATGIAGELDHAVTGHAVTEHAAPPPARAGSVIDHFPTATPAAGGGAAPVPADPERRHGPLVIAPGEVADLDSLAPDWGIREAPGPAGADLWFGVTDHALHGDRDANIAVLPTGSTGTLTECGRDQDYGVTMAAGDIRPGRFVCDLTDQNRIALLRITDVRYAADGAPDQITFDAGVRVQLHQN